MKVLRSSLVVLLFAALCASAQQPAEPAVSRVISVKGPDARKGKVRLGDEVRIGVRGYDALRKAAAAGQKQITLWINGVDSELTPMTAPYVDPKPPMTQPQRDDARVLKFRLERTADNSKMWRAILRDPFGEPETYLALSVGVSGDTPLLLDPGVSGKVKLEKTFFTPVGVFWALLVLAVIALLVYYRSDMLRSGPDVNGQKQAYSLGRSQMAWWFILILGSYIVIWLITGDRDTVTTSLLVLMGISATTAMGSVAIDANAPSRANDMRQELEAEKASLAVSPTMATAMSPTPTAQEQAAAEAVKLRMAEIDQTVANVTKPSLTTKSWLRDVLTDNNGMVALHRFQILAWTVVLGFVFLASVIYDLSMPEFNSTLLALMGISAGTYLGFKLPTNGG